MPPQITVDATDVTITLPFGIAVTGSGSDLVGAISVTSNAGTIELEGETVAIAFYEKQPWPEFGYTLYQGIAIGASRWDVVWLYCQGSNLAYVWHEGVGGPSIDYVNATGTCADTGANTETAVAFPALDLATPVPATGFTIDGGAALLLADGEPGLLVANSVPLPFVPFEVIDCTACGGGGWWELHSIAWDETLDRATFVILYLDYAATDRVLATYARSIPDFADPIGYLEIDATWTAP